MKCEDRSGYCTEPAVVYQRIVSRETGEPITTWFRACVDHRGRTFYEGNVRIEIKPLYAQPPSRDGQEG